MFPFTRARFEGRYCLSGRLLVSIGVWEQTNIHVGLLRQRFADALAAEEICTRVQPVQLCSSVSGLALDDLTLFVWGNKAIEGLKIKRRIKKKSSPMLLQLRQRFLSVQD